MNQTFEERMAKLDDAVLLASRLLLAWLFVHEGVALASNFDAAAASMAKMGVPASLLIATIALQLLGGIAIAVGWQARLGAAGLGSVLSGDGGSVSPEFRGPQRVAAFRKGSRDRRRHVRLDGSWRRSLVPRRTVSSSDEIRGRDGIVHPLAPARTSQRTVDEDPERRWRN